MHVSSNSSNSSNSSTKLSYGVVPQGTLVIQGCMVKRSYVLPDAHGNTCSVEDAMLRMPDGLPRHDTMLGDWHMSNMTWTPQILDVKKETIHRLDQTIERFQSIPVKIDRSIDRKIDS